MRDAATPDKALVYGAFGSGKTRMVSMAAVILALSLCEQGYTEARHLRGGATAPTQERRDIIISGLEEVCRPEWFIFRSKKCNWSFPALNVTLEVRAAKAQSNTTGNPIQGQNWAFAVMDEVQDQVDAYPHVLARGRSAPGGRYPVIGSATAKDSMAWREFRDGLSKDWLIERLTGPSNAFVWPSFWDELRRNLSARDAKRMVDALDVGPERAIYPAWVREENLRPIPRVGAKDWTAHILNGAGPNHVMLAGHDPGVLRNVTTLSRAFLVGKRHQVDWFTVAEFFTEQTTTEQHAEEFRSWLQRVHGVQYPGHGEESILIRVDPWTKTDTGTHKSVHDQFSALGFKVLSAAYTEKGEGRGRVPLRASVEMMNRLMCAADGTRRYFIAQGDDGKPLAPETMRSIELSEWDPYGMHEVSRKDDKRKDPTDFTSTLRYKFWAYERFRRQMGTGRAEAIY